MGGWLVRFSSLKKSSGQAGGSSCEFMLGGCLYVCVCVGGNDSGDM